MSFKIITTLKSASLLSLTEHYASYNAILLMYKPYNTSNKET